MPIPKDIIKYQKYITNQKKSHLGQIPWNKNKKWPNEIKLKISNSLKGKKHSEETKRKMSRVKKGKIPQFIPNNKGRIFTKQWIKNMSQSHIGLQIGEKSSNWKGGITPINQKIRGSLEYKLWIDSVFNRDGNYCQKCKENRISFLTAHHILNFSSYPELRFAIDNGITFCRPCHKEFHKKYGIKNNNWKQLQEFLLKKQNETI